MVSNCMQPKIKKVLINTGAAVSALLMSSPLAIVTLRANKMLGSQLFWILFIASISYDFYIYSIIQQNEYIKKEKEWFYKVFYGKTLNAKTDKEKQMWYETICIDMFMNYFGDSKK